MTPLVLYARSRRLVTSVLAIVAAIALGVAIGPASHDLAPGAEGSIPWLMLLPLVFAVTIGLANRSAMHDFDITSARALALWRLGQIAALSGLSVLGILLVTANLNDELFGHLTAVRNLAGFLGLALLTGRLIAGRLGWLVPAAWAFTALTLGDPTNPGLAWDWPVRHDNDLPALWVALTFAALGLVAAATGTREPRDEQRD